MRLVAMTLMMVLTMAGIARGEPVACQRAIAKASLAFTAATAKAFAACEQDKRLAKLPPTVDCTVHGPTAAVVAAAEGKLRAAIPKACGGKNKSCDPADGGADADEALAAIGWDAGACPNLDSGSCTNAIDDCDGIATCLTCLGRAAVGQTSTLANAAFTTSTPGDAANRCQLAIGRETAKYLTARAKALQKCRDLVFRGKIAGPCPAGDSKTLAALAKAEATKVAKLCNACGGADGACGGGDDLTPTALGFSSLCPDVTPLGTGSCGGPIASLEDLITCVDCVAAFDTDCLDAAAVPGLVGYPASCAPAPTPTVTPTPTLTPTPTVTATPPAGAEAITCERVIVKEAGKLAQVRIGALAACETRVLEGKLPPATICATETKTAAKIAKAVSRLGSKIAQACGGADRTCNVLDGDEPSLGEIGWGVSACPGFEGNGCDGALVDCDDVGGCVACIGEAAIAQATALAFGVAPAPAGSAEAKCQVAIGAATADFFKARATALAKCADAQIRGRASGPCPDPGDGKAATAIAKAEDRLIATMCKACGGGDRRCGGADDLTPAALGFAPTCPDVVVADGAACAGAIQSLDDLVACLACVVSFKTDCSDRASIPNLRGYPQECSGISGTPVPTPTTTPGGGGAVCGNAAVESGESCDDGNTSSCDACPADCRTAPVACSGTTVRHAQRVRLRAPEGALLQGAIGCVRYPQGVVALPGTGNVTGRVSGISGLATLNDFNDAVQVSFVINPAVAEINPTISFDLCTGETAPVPTDFVCAMKSASNQGTPIEPPSLVECTPVTVP